MEETVSSDVEVMEIGIGNRDSEGGETGII